MHPIKNIVLNQHKGIPSGICSLCSANEYVIQACMEEMKHHDGYILIESTANQVDQFGGYTGMMPIDFKNFVYALAEKYSFPIENIILGGDHLGPLTWRHEDSASAMEKAKELIRLYVSAGFTKIHIDTSMRLADDSIEEALSDDVIAMRSAILAKSALEAFTELKKVNPNSKMPVFVIGSEVPIPGGSTEEEDGLKVTDPADLKKTIKIFKETYASLGLEEVWEMVVAIVVQPGVEFGDSQIHFYDSQAARGLVETMREQKEFVFEGHSTDYQTSQGLKEMVEDGIAILKVGPQLTFALREGLIALEEIEKHHPQLSKVAASTYVSTLEKAMLEDDSSWKAHYHGTPEELQYARLFSYSDRARYYQTNENVKKSVTVLINNMKTLGIPMPLLSQYMPRQYKRVRECQMPLDPEVLIKDYVKDVLRCYLNATNNV